MDETYIKVKGIWMYQYRAVDKEGKTMDFYFSGKRNKKAAINFFIKAIKSSSIPEKVNIDKSGSNRFALEDINEYLSEKEKFEIRKNRYLIILLSKIIDLLKKIIRPMLGFKSQNSARVTLEGIELHPMLRKEQLKIFCKNIIEQFFSLAA